MRDLFRHIALPILRFTIIGLMGYLTFREGGYLSLWMGVSFPSLTIPLIVAATALLVGDLTFWLGHETGLRLVLRLSGVRARGTHRSRFRHRLIASGLGVGLRRYAYIALLYGFRKT